MTKPNINVTPLIDVLLVLLIIFMVITPLQPSAFKAKVPQESNDAAEPNPLALVVAVGADSSIRINTERDLGSIEHPEKAISRLKETFAARLENRAFSARGIAEPQLPENEKVEKTVFIKAPRGLDYGSVAKVIDAVKQSGAEPIGLQIDDLD